MYVFFDVFEKVKKCIFASKFLKTGPMDLKICAKKTCNLSGFPPNILSKSNHFSTIYDISKMAHFFNRSHGKMLTIDYHLIISPTDSKTKEIMDNENLCVENMRFQRSKSS